MADVSEFRVSDGYLKFGIPWNMAKLSVFKERRRNEIGVGEVRAGESNAVDAVRESR